MKMEREVLETVLTRNLKESSLQKVIDMECFPAVAKFQNFLSTVTRIKLKTVLGNGRIAYKSLIMKVFENKDDFTIDFNREYETFRTETMIYNTVLKEMEYLMEEFEDTDDILWCHLVHYIPYSCLVFEDLKAQGFNMIDRTVYLDLDHCLMAMESLGRFHGMSKIIEERGLLSVDKLKPSFIFNDLKIHSYFIWDMASLCLAIKTLWDQSWEPIIDKIKITKDSLHDRLKKLGELDESKFNVLNHGDCNKNNILFKYDWEKRPIAMRLLDFQLPHYGSPCIDLMYMLYLSAKPSVRRENLDTLLKTYHDSLLRTLNKFHFSGKGPSIEEIRDGVEKYSLLGLWLFITWYPILNKSENMDELIDYKKIEETNGEEGHSLGLYKSDSLENDLGPDLKILVQKYF